MTTKVFILSLALLFFSLPVYCEQPKDSVASYYGKFSTSGPRKHPFSITLSKENAFIYTNDVSKEEQKGSFEYKGNGVLRVTYADQKIPIAYYQIKLAKSESDVPVIYILSEEEAEAERLQR
jgi:hypothetical protein